MVPALDFSRVPTEHLRLILQLPQVAEPYKQRVQAELRSRPETTPSRRSLGNRLHVHVSAPVPGQSLLVTIQPDPPSANEIKRWLYGGHRSQHMAHGSRHRYANYRDALRREFLAYGDLALRAGVIRIEHRWRVVQQRDEDGFGLSLKPVLDAMEGVLIENDRDVQLAFGGQEAGGRGCKIERGVTLVCSRL